MKNRHLHPNRLPRKAFRLASFLLCVLTEVALCEGPELGPFLQQYVSRFAVGQTHGEVMAKEEHNGTWVAIIHAPDDADMSPEDVFEVAFMAKDRLRQATGCSSIEILFSCNKPKLRKYLKDYFMERLKPTQLLTDQMEINRHLEELYGRCAKFAAMKKKAETDGWVVTATCDEMKLKRGLGDGVMILDPLLGVRFSHDKATDKISPSGDTRSAPRQLPESPPPAKPGSVPR